MPKRGAGNGAKAVIVDMSAVEFMDAATHDKVVAIVSHLPHLIAFTICGTADDLAEESREAVLKFAASGFRDFTRIAASDVAMWRDIFLNNREALLEMLKPYGVRELVQSGLVALGRGSKSLTDRSKTDKTRTPVRNQ